MNSSYFDESWLYLDICTFCAYPMVKVRSVVRDLSGWQCSNCGSTVPDSEQRNMRKALESSGFWFLERYPYTLRLTLRWFILPGRRQLVIG